MLDSNNYRLELTVVDNNTGVIKTYQKEYDNENELNVSFSCMVSFVKMIGLPFAPMDKRIYIDYVVDDKISTYTMLT